MILHMVSYSSFNRLSLENQINGFNANYVQIILGIKKLHQVSNSSIFKMVNEKSLILTIWGPSSSSHVAQNCEESVRKYAIYEPAHGNRRQGRPKTRYSLNTSRPITNNPDGLQPREIKNIAQNRTDWKKIITGIEVFKDS